MARSQFFQGGGKLAPSQYSRSEAPRPATPTRLRARARPIRRSTRATPRTKKTSAVEHRHGERRRQPAEVAGAEIRPERGQARARRDDAEHDAERRAGDTDDRAAEQGRGELLAHRQAHRVQKRDLAPAPRDHQHLRRVDEKRAGEQGDQRERRQVRAIGTRQTQRVVARLARRQEPRPGGRTAAIASRAAAGSLPGTSRRSMRSSAAEPREALLRLGDVEHADLLTKGAGRQQASHPQALRLESDLDAELVALRERPALRPPRGSARPNLRRASRSRAPRSRPAARAAPAARGPGTGRCRAAAACGRDPADVRGHRRRDSRPRPSAASRASDKASRPGPAPDPCTDRSAMPNRLRAASCTSSAATRLMRCTASPSATPSAIATTATSARPGDCRSGPRTVAVSHNRHGAGVGRGPAGAVRIVIAADRSPARTHGRRSPPPPRNA